MLRNEWSVCAHHNTVEELMITGPNLVWSACGVLKINLYCINSSSSPSFCLHPSIIHKISNMFYDPSYTPLFSFTIVVLTS